MICKDDDLIHRIIHWAKTQAAAGADRGTPLDEEGQALAKKVGVIRPEQIHLPKVDLLPMPEDPVILEANKVVRLMDPRMDGLTLDHTLFLRQACIQPVLLAHELRHVHQVEVAGSLEAFLVEYMGQIFTCGYHLAPFELDARDWAQRVSLAN